MEEDWGNGRWQLQQVQLRQCFWNPRMDTRYSPISHSIFFPNQCSRSQFLQWSTMGSYRWRLDWLPQEWACGPSSPNPIWNIPGKNFNNFWFQVWLSCLSAEYVLEISQIWFQDHWPPSLQQFVIALSSLVLPRHQAGLESVIFIFVISIPTLVSICFMDYCILCFVTGSFWM